MKPIISKLASMCAMVMALTSCTQSIIKIEQVAWFGAADLTITNLDTGDTYQQTTTATIIIGGQPAEYILFAPGERMRLQFTPPKDYAKEKFSVNFKVLDYDVNVTKSPYVYEFTIPENSMNGDYAASCSAMCEAWDAGSCTQSITFGIVQRNESVGE